MVSPSVSPPRGYKPLPFLLRLTSMSLTQFFSTCSAFEGHPHQSLLTASHSIALSYQLCPQLHMGQAQVLNQKSFLGQPTTVSNNGSTSNKAWRVGSQKHHHIGNLAGLPSTCQWHVASNGVQLLLCLCFHRYVSIPATIQLLL